MIVIGLTGGIGMGKSTTAQMFKDEGAAVWDADGAVHRLYAPGGDGVPVVLEAFPQAGSLEEGIDRHALSRAIVESPSALETLESIVHPLVRTDRLRFIKSEAAKGTKVVVCDIPLLLEGEGHDMFDIVVVATAAEDVRRDRVLSRPEMTVEKFEMIRDRQMPDGQKRELADYLVFTDRGFEDARNQVRQILTDILEKQNSAPPVESP